MDMQILYIFVGKDVYYPRAHYQIICNIYQSHCRCGCSGVLLYYKDPEQTTKIAHNKPH